MEKIKYFKHTFEQNKHDTFILTYITDTHIYNMYHIFITISCMLLPIPFKISDFKIRQKFKVWISVETRFDVQFIKARLHTYETYAVDVFSQGSSMSELFTELVTFT